MAAGTTKHAGTQKACPRAPRRARTPLLDGGDPASARKMKFPPPWRSGLLPALCCSPWSECGRAKSRSGTKFTSTALACYPEFPDDGVISGFNHFIHNGRQRNALAQIRSDSRFWHIGQNETREPKLVRADSPEGVPRKSLISGINSPALSHHLILESWGQLPCAKSSR